MLSSKPITNGSYVGKILIFFMLCCVTAVNGQIQGGITYRNITRDGVGLAYARTRSPEIATVQVFQASSLEEPLPWMRSPALPK